MIFNMASVRVSAEEKAGSGKYVSDVFIAYEKTEAKAAEWLEKNGWEPVKGDFNSGKASFFDDSAGHRDNVAAVMGIKRTDDKDDAITDMAVMNMTGGYSLPKYEDLIKEKKAQINEMINHFMIVINEFRCNRKGEGSEFGKKRADMAYDLLNRFYDGDPDSDYAVNDTGMKLGELFEHATRKEGGKDGGDLEQIMLESSGPAMLAVESVLVMAADTGEENWLERASGLTGEEMAENLIKYAPEAEGQDVAPSAVAQFLGQKYGETAKMMAEQWTDVHDDMIWFEDYNENNDLWPHDDEPHEDYLKRVEQYFKDLETSDEERYLDEYDKYYRVAVLYNGLYEIPYQGDWGESLGDFFNPADDEGFSGDADNFLPLAAALSEGQRVGLDYLSLEMMLIIGLGNEKGLDQVVSELEKVFKDQKEMDIYTGVNRAAFRGGVALTNNALMEEHAGRGNAYDKIWDNTGIVAITSYCSAVVGLVTMGVGAYMMKTGVVCISSESTLRNCRMNVLDAETAVAQWQVDHPLAKAADVPQNLQQRLKNANNQLSEAQGKTQATRMGVAGRWVLGIGGAILIGAAIVKGIQLWKYYDRDMKPIPRMIVDESDIVTYLTDDNGKPLLDENGKQKKNIEFNTYEFYTAVKCNRPEVGEIGDWQDGVKEYKDHNCYDIADLNADMGQEWVALYAVKSSGKGDPILADSLTLQYGSKKTPEGCTKGLHLFTYTNAVDLGDTAWAFNNNKKGVYFFWDEDVGAFDTKTASTFTAGNIALAGIGGLILGIAGATLVMRARRRKEDKPEAA